MNTHFSEKFSKNFFSGIGVHWKGGVVFIENKKPLFMGGVYIMNKDNHIPHDIRGD